MIVCFEGTPGSGKTYEAIRKIIDNLLLGRVVYTNIDGLDEPLKRESIKSYCGLSDYDLETRLIYLPHFKICEFWKHVKSGSLILIDEVHKWFSNRDWASAKNQELASWASTHRHHGFDVVLITQKLEKVDTHVRSLVEWTYRYKRINMFGSLVKQKYKRASFVGDDTTGKPLDNKFYTYNKRIFACYKSFVSDDVKELGIMQHSNVLKHPVFFLVPLSLILFLVLFFKSSFVQANFLGKKNDVSISQSNTTKPAVVKQFPFEPLSSFVPVPSSVETSEEKSKEKVLSEDCILTMSGEAKGVIYESFDCGGYSKMVENGVEKYRVKNNSSVLSVPSVHSLPSLPSVPSVPSEVVLSERG